ncbi:MULTISPECIES: gluconokinase, GntK/IdnK-type [Paenarthrobacter]|uniref:Gluconokinase, GntK/IdnK-type n=1 Tax=Paenarthrobacter ureafaciens TaxID=37931 RepID=A0AAX3EJK7_PAEUR|nr:MULTISPECIES: gluconokinase, GntK/IdnK-type [Paenarthrobacter]NKR11921.1 glycosyl hydrolase [Arthrobacter sp. M5]NKR15515.1 glycosyl hydrolase [Arthrobacter sp. M6]OEH58508.1 glycosyl hydrolase [Arthrobacter sp. D4]OEH64795.1 glycosyl hydrolase [Arthrobacter sp. D2]MDO5863162.1 gluconokinase, GntK/IdnK-type [Paenarthrobacter sp. SD-2]
MTGKATHVVVMGVAGCGKSTVGAALAERLGAEFLDGDSLHPQANIDKMAAGTPLNDADRAPWLAEIGRRFSTSDAPLVIACSALKRAYRDIIREGDPTVAFVHLHGTRELLGERMNNRPGHFMPTSLLDSQLATLEHLQSDEDGVMVDIENPVDQIVDRAAEFLLGAQGGNIQDAAARFPVDLKAAPFNLDDAAVQWVESTIGTMSLEEKIGQLFINHNNDYSPEYLDEVLEKYHVGGMRYRPGPSGAVQEHIRYAQSKTRIPLLVASNPEMGGAGSCDDGTFVSTHLQAGSHPDKGIARQMGRVAGVETAALGCNWAFAPIVDIHYNWRNTVISTRAFGNTPEIVVERAKEYFDGISESPTVCAMKHFPGDGIDERDQHVVTSYNTLGYEEWNRTYGHVYREMIGHGVQSIMVGHIGAPEVSRHFRPGMTDSEIRPATLAPELLQDLLRGELGFNGLVLTDASLMVGLTQTMKRRDLVPATIAAGCDMFLFFRNPEEDFQFMLDGYKSGVITEERLQDALRRILGIKASLGLHTASRESLVPSADVLSVIGSEAHKAVAAEIADKTVTLVKDTANNLPIRPETHKRIRLYGISGGADFTRADPLAYLDTVKEELEAAGFSVDVFKTAEQRSAAGETGMNFMRVLSEEAAADYAERYDAAFVFANVKGFAQEAAIRIKWSSPMAAEIPWYATEVPTVFVSLNQPNHLIDVPMVKTAIHAHAGTREAIRATIHKIRGNSEFQGTFNDNVFCDSFDTRL